MTEPLNILIVEDVPEDAELLVMRLRQSGFELDWVCVDNEADYRKHLEEGLDLIFSDYSMPHFSGLRAMDVLKESGLDIPFIIISGSIGEETAVEAMRQGVSDYLMKDRLTRLGASVTHTLEESRNRRDKNKIRTALRESERLARAAMNALSASIVILDNDGWILDFNLAWEDQARNNGADPSKTGKGVNYLAVCDNTRGTDAHFAGKFADGTRKVIRGELDEFVTEYPCHTPGVQRWFIGKVSRFPGDGPVRVVVSHENITERKLAEQRLALQSVALDAAANGILITDNRGLIHWVNEAFTKMTGYSAQEVIGKNPKILKSNEHDHSFYRQMWAEIASGQVWSGELTNRRKDGSIYSEQMTITPLRDEAGVIRNYIAIKSDITERTQAQRELHRFNRTLRMLSDCNEVLIRAEDEFTLLHDICQVAVETGGYHLAWVGYALEDESKTIQPMAQFGENQGYLEGIQVSWSEHTPQGHGPAGRAVRSRKMVVLEDSSEDIFLAPWMNRINEYGLRGIICVPIQINQKVLGVLALYTTHKIKVGADESKLLGELADNLAYGIKNLRTRMEQRQLLNSVVKLAEGVSARTGTAFFEQLVLSMTESVGAQSGYLITVDPGNPLHGLSSVAVVEGQIRKIRELDLTGGPCAQLLHQDAFVIPNKLRELYPEILWLESNHSVACAGQRLMNPAGQIIGVVVVLFRERLLQTELVTATLKIFATRMVLELERQEIDRQVRQQASLLDKARDAIVVRDMNHKITYWNKGAERLYGWSSSEVLGRSSIELLYLMDFDFTELESILLEKGEWTGEIRHRTKSGNSVEVEVRKTLVRDSEGQPKAVLSINTDITESKKLEQQFLRAQRMESIGTLAGGIAHDLNNVLAPIMMSIDLLKLSVVDVEGQEVLQTIGESARRGAEMVSQVLSFARGMEGKRMEIQPKQLVNNIIKMMKETFPKNIEVVKSMASHHQTFMGDLTQMEQVLMNLCVNARDAMPDGGKLSISVEEVEVDREYARLNLDAETGQYLCLQVEDTGQGIPQKILDKIFDPFFTTKEVGKGTGLGLSTSLAIIKSHGGFIRVFSKEGKGTRFRVYLPAGKVSSREIQPVEMVELPRGNGEKILVVDDEASIRQITRQTLEAYGYQVVLASNGAEAVFLYAQLGKEISAVIMDMMMPVMDGATAIEALRKLNPALTVIAASGISTDVNVSKAVRAGVGYFLGKPYTAETLLKVLHQTLENQD